MGAGHPQGCLPVRAAGSGPVRPAAGLRVPPGPVRWTGHGAGKRFRRRPYRPTDRPEDPVRGGPQWWERDDGGGVVLSGRVPAADRLQAPALLPERPALAGTL